MTFAVDEVPDPIPPGDEVALLAVTHPPAIPLHGRYTSLVPLANRHTESLFRHLGGPSNAAIWTFLPVAAPQTREAMKAIIQQFTAASNSPEQQYFAVLSSSSGNGEGPENEEAVGIICYMAVVPEHRRLEVAWVVFGGALKRTRQATEAFYLILNNAFSLGYERVEWKANSLNEPSLSAARRLGFTSEGIFRKHWIMKGKRRDTAWFSMIDDDWPAVRRGFEAWLGDSNFDEHGRQKRGLKECRKIDT